MGHEPVGEVVALGPDADASVAKVGQRYIVYPWIGCGECGVCKSGNENICSFSMKGLGTAADGGYSTHLMVPDAKYLVPFSGVSEEFASTLACSGLTAYGAIQKARQGLADGFTDSDRLLIMGAGGLGMQAIKIAKAMFPNCSPSAADIDPAKRAAALAAGAAEAIDPNDAAQVGAIAGAAMTGKGGFAAIIDFVGAGSTVQTATSLLRRGGSLVVVGLFGGAMPLSTAMLPLRAWKIQGSYVGTPQEMRELAELAAQGKIEEIPIIKRPLEDASVVLEELKVGFSRAAPQNGSD